jgi:ribosome-binding protein aMBF1 (putative translation factor)
MSGRDDQQSGWSVEAAVVDALRVLRGELVFRWREERRQLDDDAPVQILGRLSAQRNISDRTDKSWRWLRLPGTVSRVDEALSLFAANVRRLRQESSLTQEDVADRAAMDPAEVRRIESARRDPGVRVLTRLSRGLGVKPADLFDGIE